MIYESWIGHAVEFNDTEHYRIRGVGRVVRIDHEPYNKKFSLAVIIDYKGKIIGQDVFFPEELRLLTQEEEALAVLGGLL